MIFGNIIFRKSIAIFFLSLLTTQLLLPTAASALTSGPVQPETKQFATAGTSDMVDLFTGGFKYNIPVMDIDGYPINLNYSSGVGMDDEASWVGLGWNLNVGAINRGLRGLPDDLLGDEVTTEHYVAPKVTVGGKGTVKGEFSGWAIGKLTGSLSLGVFSDSYTGMGAEVGANAGLSLTEASSGTLTLGLGVNSNTSDGVNLSPSLNLSLFNAKSEDMVNKSIGLSLGLGYNTRQGLKNLTLTQSFGFTTTDVADPTKSGSTSFDVGGIGFSFNTPAFYPQIGIPFKTTNRTYSVDLGGVNFLIFTGGGLSGYKYKREILSRTNKNPAFGFLYANKGTNVPKAMMDFMREKDNPVVRNMPNIAMPIATPDVFSYSSQLGGGQFRLYRGGNGVVFDPAVNDVTNTGTAGLDLGFGTYFHGGVTFFKQEVSNKTNKWKGDNTFLANGDYKSANTIGEEPAYFKQMDEKNVGNPVYEASIGGEGVVHVSLNALQARSELKSKNNEITSVAAPLAKQGRQVRRTAISYLTGSEGAKAALTRSVESYPDNKVSSFTPAVPTPDKITKISRATGTRANHLSEITVTGDDGKRMVYGVPVYNNFQEEYSFAVDPAKKAVTADINRNLIGFNLESDGSFKHNYPNAVDKYFHREKQPAYATSFLLSAVLSPDYVDLTDNGITDDDLGTAVKFNYTRTTSSYKWRTPSEANKALYNRGLNADPDDDKCSIVYGEKELWYLSSIETKNKIMFFITDDRKDGLGVTGPTGAVDKSAGNKQRLLKEVRLYSKKDLSTPIKTAVFDYDYLLCNGVPNYDSTVPRGKLTLTALSFKYGSSTKGTHYPYTFRYSGGNPGYAYLATDRWGNYKLPNANNNAGLGALRNDEFPYTTQKKSDADSAAASWNLTNINLPTGGDINIKYESGDYAYVQDQPAMQMVKLVNEYVDDNGVRVNNLFDAEGLVVQLDRSLRGSSDAEKLTDFITNYLNGTNNFYARLYVNVSDNTTNPTDANYDFVSCYGEVVKVIDRGGGQVCVILKTMQNGNVSSNPFIFSAWQKMRTEYPMYAYPGYKNRVPDDMPITAALSAIVNSLGNLREITENFYARAKRKHFSWTVDFNKSFCRIAKADGFKLGGSARVKRVTISDAWNTITGIPNTGATYGQEYTYTTTWNGKTISSGVASYEPHVGGDENPLHLPLRYSEPVRGGLDNYFYLERPFGESLYPAPIVGYSKVLVKDINPATGTADAAPKTGWVQHEFYTARDFPVQVDYDHSPENYNYDSKGWFSLLGADIVHEQALSQGYVIKLNDMHGKPKAERVFNQSGAEIASTLYYFNAKNLDAGTQCLVNKVDVVDEKGNITKDQIIGREIEMTTDMREQETANIGKTIQLGGDVIPSPVPIPPIWPVPHWPMSHNNEYRLFRSAAVLKTVQYSGVLDRVVKTINGSTVTTKNLLFDAVTGDAVVTTTNNEFDDPVYQVNIPAYWIYAGMGGAYRNNNLMLTVSTGTYNAINSTMSSILLPGDELVDLASANNHYWVVQTKAKGESAPSLKLINKGGAIAKLGSVQMKLCRSGYRNLLTAPGASFVSLRNPVENGVFRFKTDEELASMNVLEAKATLYDQTWGARLPCMSIPPGYDYERPDRDAYIRKANPLTDKLFPAKAPNDPSEHGNDGAVFFNTSGQLIIHRTDPFWYGRLRNIGAWPQYADNNYNYYIYETTITLPPAEGYSIGYSADDEIEVFLDDVGVGSLLGNTPSNHEQWQVVSLNAQPGKHKLRVKTRNLTQPNRAFAMEIYNLTIDHIAQMSSAASNIVYSTTDWFTYPANVVESVNGWDTVRFERYSTPIDYRINPYQLGFLGNWHPQEGKAFLVNRTGQQLSAPAIRKNGAYQNFTPYWYFSAVAGGWVPTSNNSSRWVSTGTTSLFDAQGNGLESKDALGIYKSALYSFNNAMPAAVAGNAMQRELFYDSFEDYDYRSSDAMSTTCPRDSSNIFNRIQEVGQYANWIDNQVSHTGKSSLKLPSPLMLYTYVHDNIHHTQPYLDFSTDGEYQRIFSPTLYPNGFSPKPNSTYIFSAWVKDGQPAATTSDFKLGINGTNYNLTVIASVEGWKLVVASFSVGAGKLQWQLSAGSSATRVDDIRIFPVKATMKTFAYDPKSQRLMAEMDENNLATLYEYDDEGTLIRLKKETDRGIMTIKENRSSYRFKN
ncbi:hypothetical protein [Chitinophaga sp. Ak27]|uniref:hypothetical protein n=1 Tax=Chitinophaga sp. Ak27 TaxID=2726116 RepID=UPI00145C9DE9|nr:hypothetical protein [Chitinophaga sp. Ak27]NLU92482.1 hypothetical protein [Chitinophaga sp. Ak27]